MNDLISRQAAIDVAKDWYDGLICGSFKGLEKRLKALPSVQPRKGKITYTHFCEELWGQSSICSLCGCSWQIADDGEDNFCPNCGCRMEEGDSE